jgi:hypothetical protein
VTALLKAEIAKLASSRTWLAVVICPLAIVVLGIGLVSQGRSLASLPPSMGPLLQKAVSALWGQFMLPLLGTMVTIQVAGIEHRNRTWSLLFAMPVGRARVFWSKWLVSWFLLVIASLLLAIAFAGFACLALPRLNPALHAQPALLFPTVIRGAIACLPMLLLQFVLAWRWSGVVFPMAVGIVATIAVPIVGSSRYWLFLPWTYPLMAMNAGSAHAGPDAIGLALALFAPAAVIVSVLVRSARLEPVEC